MIGRPFVLAEGLLFMANIIGDAEYWPGEADIVACFLCLVISILAGYS